MLRNYNGTGSVTVAATAQIQVQYYGDSTWNGTALLLITFVTNSSSPGEDRIVPLPDAAVAARAIYTQPTGSSGYTFDLKAGYVTA